MKRSLSPERVLKFILFITPIVALLWFCWQYFSITGKLNITYDFSGESPYIGEWEPRGRALDRSKNLRTGESHQDIVGEPVYIPVTVPRSYNTADVTLEYRNPEQPLVEFGVVTSEEPLAVRLYPFESLMIDEALGTWHQTTDERGVTLLQKNTQFETVADFESALPKDKNVVTYQYAPGTEYRDPNYTAQSGTVLDIKPFLRGTHEFVTYIKNETLNVAFDFTDTNMNFNEDVVKVEVRDSNGTVIYDDAIADDGDVTGSGVATKPGTIEMNIPDLPEGTYSLRVPVTSDIVITGIRTSQSKFVVKNRFFPIRNEAYRDQFPNMNVEPTSVFVNADVLTFQASRPTSFQEVRVGNEAIFLDTVSEPKEWVGTIGAQQVQELRMPLNDVTVQGHGYFAFTKASFFDPDYRVQPLTQHSTTAAADYIIFQNYTPAEDNDRGTKTQTATVDFEGVFGDRKELQFVLSAPGIATSVNTIQINEMEFDFEREPMHRRILNRFNR